MNSDESQSIERAKKHLDSILREQIIRIRKMTKAGQKIDYSKLKSIIIGVAGGDGIGPIISSQTIRVLKFLLREEIEQRRVILREINGLTLENRVRQMKAVPDEVISELRECHVFLKGPTTTPEAGSEMPNIESANVYIRKVFDLYANVRPIRIPSLGIDWTFFRENTEGEYILGSKGLMVTPDLALDFKVITRQGTERIIRAAFDYAKKANKGKVTVVTKANVIKTTDGLFLQVAREISKEYPEIEWDSWYVDVFSAKLIDERRRKDFKVIVLPNLYGDIVTDEAAEIQGGVGTAGSANLGDRYAMFEAIHGSAPRMIEEGRGDYADPSSLMRAAAMMLEHIGLNEKAKQLHQALDICCHYEAKLKVTGHSDGASTKDFSDYLISTLKEPNLEERWSNYTKVGLGKGQFHSS
jgi:isocitrate dehydrogenase (NAD+)